MMRGLAAAICALALAACSGAKCGSAPTAPAAPVAASARPADSTPPGAAPIRYVIGGDSRQDDAHVVIWALHEVKARGAAALVFLGDMELRPDLEDHFRAELGALKPVRFLPVLGNHDTARRKHGGEASKEDREKAMRGFASRFLDGAGAGVDSAFPDKLVYSVDLPGGVHFVALDNVTQSGFGADQLAWLRADLDRARASGAARHVVVGMHKAFAGSGITHHAMEEDGPAAVADSDAALALCEQDHVELIVASHFHAFAEYAQRGIRSFISGGMGAPLDTSRGKEAAFHHVLAVTVPPEGPLAVEVVRFPGTPVFATEDEP